MRHRSAFVETIRRGRRARRGHLVVHFADRQHPVIGFVVGKTVGNAVVRHRVVRKLRHICAQLAAEDQVKGALVIRVLPGADTDTFATLDRDVRQALARLTKTTKSGQVRQEI